MIERNTILSTTELLDQTRLLVSNEEVGAIVRD